MDVQETTFTEILKIPATKRSADEHLCVLDGICRRYPTPFANEFASNSYRTRILADYDLKVAYHMLKLNDRTNEADVILARYSATVKLKMNP